MSNFFGKTRHITSIHKNYFKHDMLEIREIFRTIITWKVYQETPTSTENFFLCDEDSWNDLHSKETDYVKQFWSWQASQPSPDEKRTLLCEFGIVDRSTETHQDHFRIVNSLCFDYEIVHESRFCDSSSYSTPRR